MCVLVAEDEPLILELLVEVLEDAGHEVVTASNAPEALDHISRNPGRFTALVTDLYMPPHEITGADLVTFMRQGYPDIPVIVATATVHALKPEWLADHRVEVLTKPYLPDDLVSKLSGMLGQ